MPNYIYSDEDNQPMFDELVMRRTTYSSAVEMRAAERGEDPSPRRRKPARVCGNCQNFNGLYCTKYWNNLDESFLDRDRDGRDPGDAAGDETFEIDTSLDDSEVIWDA